MPSRIGLGSRGTPERRLAWGLLLWLGLTLLVWRCSAPPAPLAQDADPSRFSAGRALALLERLSPDAAPRPAASAAATATRERILAELRDLGFRPEVQRAFSAGSYGQAGFVNNVLARRRGSAELGAVLLLSHYDSVAAGPGISDDLAGVASALEIARLLAEEPPLARDVIWLFSEGEEDGLLGAQAFLEHAWMDDVEFVVNLEARGASGPSRLFETGAGNRDWIAAFARHARTPSASSVSVEVYRRMPNDTDYTVFRRRAVQGLNFAFIGDVHTYHTPLDDLLHLSPASLQHHGDNALAALRSVQEIPDRVRPGPDAVYQDLLGWRLIWVSERLAFLLALLGMLATGWGTQRAVRARWTNWERVSVGMLLPLLAGVLAWILARVFTLVGGYVRPGAAHPWPGGLALLGAGLLATCLAVISLRRHGGSIGLAYGSWLLCALLGVLLAVAVPGAAFLLWVPALVLGLVSLVVRTDRHGAARVQRMALVGLVAAVLFAAPIQLGLIDAFGRARPQGVSVPVALMACLLAPALAASGRAAAQWIGGISLAALLTGALAQRVLPERSETRPEPARVEVLVDPDWADLALAQVWTRGSGLPLSWRELAGLVAMTPELHGRPLEMPDLAGADFELEEVVVLDEEHLLLSGRLSTPQPADRVGLWFAGGRLKRLEVDGWPCPRDLAIFGIPAQGVPLAMTVRRESLDLTAPLDGLELTLERRFHGVPPEAQDIVASRPADFVPYGKGDTTEVVSRVVLAEAR